MNEIKLQSHDLPHNIDAEEGVLGSILIDQEAMREVKDIVPDSSYFHIARNGLVYAAMLDMFNRGDQIDMLTVKHELDQRDVFVDRNVAAFLSHLISATPTSIHARGYAQIVADMAAKRQLINVASIIAERSFNGQSPIEVINHGRQLLNSVASRVVEQEDEPSSAPAIPALPDNARVEYDPADNAGWFIDMYTNYASGIAPMTPISFLESSALWLGSLAIARRVCAPMDFGDIYPNLFIVWVAASTIWHKTTALNVMCKIISRAFPHMLMSADVTPEQLLSSMAGEEPANKLYLAERDVQLWTAGRNYAAQRGICMDELSGMMSLANRDYNAGMIEYLMRLYNCEDLIQRERRAQGLAVVRGSYFSFLSASTPMALAPSLLIDTLWENGWWPRCALLTPEIDRPEFTDSTESGNADEIITTIQRMYNRLPAPVWPDGVESRPAIIESDAMAAWKRYYKATNHDMIVDGGLDYRLIPAYGRLHIHALKMALIMATLDWGCGKKALGPTPVVSMSHMARAITIAESWRASAHRLLSSITTSAENRFMQRVLTYVIGAGVNGITLRDIYKNIGRPPLEVERALNQLIMTGEIEVFEYGSRRGGPRRPRYRRVVG